MSDNDNEAIESSVPESNDLEQALAELYEPKHEETSDEDIGADDDDAHEDNDADNDGGDDEPEEEADDEKESFQVDNYKNLPKDLREKLKGLDESVQQTVVDSYNQMQRNFSAKSRELSQSKQLSEAVDKAFKENGFDNVKPSSQQKLIANYVTFEKQLKVDPASAIKRLAEYHKLTPEQLGYNASAAKEAPDSDYDDDFLTDSEKFLKKQIETQSSKITQLEQLLQQQSQRETQTAVQKFASAKDESGSLLHPHFDKVKSIMMDLADVNPNYTIEDLYKKAVRLDDDLYEETLQSEKQRIVEESKRKKAERLEKAKKMSKQSLKRTDAKTSESLSEDEVFEKLAVEAGFN